MDAIPIGLALTAGALAVVNPCGFALLPAYASMLVLDDQRPGRVAAIGRALGLAAAMTLGFVAVFGVFGLLLASVAGQILSRLPWFTVVLGLVLVLAGGWLAAGRTLPGPTIATRRGPALTRSFTSMTFFGASYALASLGCTIGPFLITVVATFRAGSLVGGIAVFATYALGMGVVVATVSVAVALARSGVVAALRRSGGVVARVSGVLLIASGAYVAYYGWYEIKVLGGGSVDDPVIASGAAVQRWIATGLDRLGVAAAAITLTALLAIVFLVRRTRRT